MNIRIFKTLDIAFGWLAFVIAFIVYYMTVAPSVSFWDCGEFISAAYRLEVAHPPGAPMYLLIARIFSIFASDVTQVAFAVNMLSVVSSALTITFLFWTISYFAKRMIAPDKNYTNGKIIAIISSGMIGAMVFTFSDSFWFSAVESIPYPLSSLFTAFVFWAMLRWSEMENKTLALRWVLLIALLMGMSIGVHLLNLLTLPALAMIFYYRKFLVTKWRVALALIASILVIAIVLWGIVPGSIRVASQFELFAVNTLGLGYNSGFLIWAFLTFSLLAASIYVTNYVDNKYINYFIPSLSMVMISVPFFSGNTFINIVLLVAMVYGVYYLTNNMKQILNFVMLILTLIMIGYSCYATVVIRSNANTVMNQNNPENVFNLLYYLGREQYGDSPLLKGQYYNAEIVDYEQGRPIYVQRNGRYEIVDHRPVTVYSENQMTFFPRMWSSQQIHVDAYKSWGGVRPTQRTPNFSNNMRFFIDYQLNWMYWRYFMWNFSGRQNDIQGHGNVIHGNWISGIPFIDNPRLGDQSKLPDHLKNNKANNRYFMLPLLLGLIGLGYQLFKHIKDWTVVMLLFIFTGIAIVVFLNQYPHQPRERDYSYVGSFYTFSIWIGLGVIGLFQLMRRFLPGIVSGAIAGILCLPIPYIMASENWDDHDRSNRYVARDFGYNYLISCAPNSILFTYGDNDTFPVWYQQNVEGVGSDVKVACLPYFASDWYIDQMKYATWDAEPLPLTFERELYEPTVRDVVYYSPDRGRGTGQEDRSHISIDSLLRFIANDRVSEVQFRGGRVHTYHKNRLFWIVNRETVLENGTVRPEDAHLIIDTIVWNMNKNHLVKNEMMTLDMLRTNKWKRPVYFTSIGAQQTLGLDEYFQNEGAAYRLVPIKSNRQGRIDSEIMYENLMNKFRWGNINDPDVYLDHTILRTIRVVRVRDNFKHLALQLMNEGDFERARKVIERCDSLMPIEIFTPGMFDVNYARTYYALGEGEKGDRYLRALVKAASQELEFFFSLDDQKLRTCEMEAQMAMEAYRRSMSLLAEIRREKLYEEFEPGFEKYIRQFQTRMR